MDKERVLFPDGLTVHVKKIRLNVKLYATQYDGTIESNRNLIDWTRGSKTPIVMEKYECNCDIPESVRRYPVLVTESGWHEIKKGYWVCTRDDCEKFFVLTDEVYHDLLLEEV